MPYVLDELCKSINLMADCIDAIRQYKKWPQW